MIRDVEDLDVFKESMKLLAELYEFLKRVPKSEYDTIVQCRKCGKSIPPNITEGFAKRRYEAEFKRFLMIAIGSSDELITHLKMISIIVPKLSEDAKTLAEKYKVLSKRMNKLCTNWRTGFF